MTQRERTMTVGLGVLLGGILLLGVGYFVVIGPLVEKSKAVTKLEAEIEQRWFENLEIEAKINKFEQQKRRSLPADVKLSRGKYADLLNNMIRKADFPPGYKIVSSEPNNKSAPQIANKKPAYTMLNFEVSGKADYYHLLDFMQSFYAQPLLHTIKKISVLRPTDARSRERRELDVTMTIEALVLDNAYDRPVLLPAESHLTILAGAAPFVALNLAATQVAVPSGLAPDGILAKPDRTYLAAAGKNLFFGPTPPKIERKKDDRVVPDTPAQEDSMPFIVLTSVVGYSDGKLVAALRDKLTNTDYTITQTPTGKISVYSSLNQRSRETGERIENYGWEKQYGSQEIICGTEAGKNYHAWRVRRVNLMDIILETPESKEAERTTSTKPNPIAYVGGGSFTVVEIDSKMIYTKLHLGQTLDKAEALTSGEARRAIYAPPLGPSDSEVSTQDKGR